MKKIKYFTIAVICSMVLIMACDDNLLDTSNPNAPTTETFWETEQDAVRATNSAYQLLQYNGMYTRFAHIVQDLRADDSIGDSPAPNLQQMGFFNFGSVELWDDSYRGIFRANQVIQNVPDVEMDETLKERLIGEAKFLRGLYYFHLVTTYRNIPLILEVAESEEDYYVPQSEPAEVWEQIIQDFSDAKDVLPESYSDDDIGRATWGSAAGFLGRSYLYNNDFDQADGEFQEIIQSNNYELVDDYRQNFTSENENNEESLFEVQFDRDVFGTEWGGFEDPAPDWGRTGFRAILYAPRGLGWNDVLPTQTLYDAYQEEETNDGEPDPRLVASLFYQDSEVDVYGQSWEDRGYGDDEIFWRKYQNDDFDNENEARSGINHRLMRYADILLMYAETRNELGDQGAAAQYIQEVRDRANLPDRENEFSQLTQEEMRDRIAQERFLEFSGEGLRFHDIRRWGWLDDPERLSFLEDRDSEFEAYVPGREWLPIPQGELDTNPQLEQNPAW